MVEDFRSAKKGHHSSTKPSSHFTEIYARLSFLFMEPKHWQSGKACWTCMVGTHRCGHILINEMTHYMNYLLNRQKATGHVAMVNLESSAYLYPYTCPVYIQTKHRKAPAKIISKIPDCSVLCHPMTVI